MDKITCLINQINAWRANGFKLGLATVANTWGSSPCPTGSMLIVNEKGGFAGSVSGGCIETQVISETLEIINEGGFALLEYGVTDSIASSAGLGCGGKIEIFIEQLNEELVQFLSNRLPCVRVIDLNDGVWSSFHHDAIAENFSLYPRAIDWAFHALKYEKSFIEKVDRHLYFFQTLIPNRKLIIVGGVRIAQSLVPMASEAGYDVTIIDPRPAFANKDRFPNVSIVCEWPNSLVLKDRLDSNTAVVTLIHDWEPDDMALSCALRSNAFYIGALGSKKTHSKRVQRLKDAGFSAQELKRVNAPIGLDIGALTPQEIAVSILSQIISFKNSSISPESSKTL